MSISNYSQILLLVFPVFLLAGAICDVLTLKLPNALNLIGLVLFFPISWLIGMPMDDILMHILISFCILLIGFGAFAAGLFGGGDSKFIAVVALWIGFDPLLDFVFYTALFGGVMGLIVLIGGRFIPDQYQPSFFRAMTERRVVPYGTAMSLAALFVYRDTSVWSLLMS